MVLFAFFVKVSCHCIYMFFSKMIQLVKESRCCDP